MLSPHEIAALMLLKNATEQCALDRADLDSLLERKLVAFEENPGGMTRTRITADGAFVLAAVTRMR